MQTPDRAPVWVTLHNQAKPEGEEAGKVGLSFSNDLEFHNEVLTTMAFQT